MMVLEYLHQDIVEDAEEDHLVDLKEEVKIEKVKNQEKEENKEEEEDQEDKNIKKLLIFDKKYNY